MSYTQINPNAKGLEDLNMTTDEVNRFSEALKKKEFVDMLGDYMNEISDPKNKVICLKRGGVRPVPETAGEGGGAAERDAADRPDRGFLHQVHDYPEQEQEEYFISKFIKPNSNSQPSHII